MFGSNLDGGSLIKLRNIDSIPPNAALNMIELLSLI